MIYLDHNATTPVAEAVFDAMRPFLTTEFGNPSSVHRAGRVARTALDTAREQIAELVGAHPGQVIFTSGGTEANNLALMGACSRQARRLIGATEHSAMLDPALRLQRAGSAVELIPVTAQGVVESAVLTDCLTQAPAAFVSVMWANNETGVINDIPTLASLARSHGAIFHTDAVQAIGKLAVNFAQAHVDLMTLTAHKIYGPKGVGALIARREVSITPLIDGGGQERGLRGGTENLAGIVGFGAAAALARDALQARSVATAHLRDQLERDLAQMAEITVFGQHADRVPNTVQFGVRGFDSEALLMGLDREQIAVSSGSACHAGKGEPSHVLRAMGIDEDLARAAIRVSFGVGNTAADVDALVAALHKIIASVPASMRAGLLNSA